MRFLLLAYLVGCFLLDFSRRWMDICILNKIYILTSNFDVVTVQYTAPPHVAVAIRGNKNLKMVFEDRF
jgi:hypothetical protein